MFKNAMPATAHSPLSHCLTHAAASEIIYSMKAKYRLLLRTTKFKLADKCQQRLVTKNYCYQLQKYYLTYYINQTVYFQI